MWHWKLRKSQQCGTGNQGNPIVALEISQCWRTTNKKPFLRPLWGCGQKYVCIREKSNILTTWTVTISAGDLYEINEKRKILYPGEEKWLDIENISDTGIPDGFDLDVLTKYLSMAHVLLDGEKYSFEVGKPSRKGINEQINFSKSEQGYTNFIRNQEYRSLFLQGVKNLGYLNQQSLPTKKIFFDLLNILPSQTFVS